MPLSQILRLAQAVLWLSGKDTLQPITDGFFYYQPSYSAMSTLVQRRWTIQIGGHNIQKQDRISISIQ
jgi:hypothetical protein